MNRRALALLLCVTLGAGGCAGKAAPTPATGAQAAAPAQTSAPGRGAGAAAAPAAAAAAGQAAVPPAGAAAAPATAAPQPIPGPIYLLGDQAGGFWPAPVLVAVPDEPLARPQFGVAGAPLVVEALAEGEITRWWTFINGARARIGPVRSARIYAVAMARAYGIPLAHAGGNTDALAELQRPGHKDLDEIYGAGAFFFRTSDRRMPHNLFTSTDLLDRGIRARGYAWAPVPTTPRAPAPGAPTGPIRRVDVQWHPLNRIAWLWEEDGYRRYTGGQPHPLADAPALKAASLIFLRVGGRYRNQEDGWVLDLEQGGPAAVVAGGTRWDGTWAFGPGGFRLLPAGGSAPPLPAGTAWVHLLTDWSAFTVQP